MWVIICVCPTRPVCAVFELIAPERHPYVDGETHPACVLGGFRASIRYLGVCNSHRAAGIFGFGHNRNVKINGCERPASAAIYEATSIGANVVAIGPYVRSSRLLLCVPDTCEYLG